MAMTARGSPWGDHERMWIRKPPWLVKSSSCIDIAPLLRGIAHRLATRNA
jgi:hypothetical protein